MRMNWLARLKTFLARRMLLTEFCHRCGREQPLIWWCESDQLWTEITGWHGNGILCPECFDHLARQQRRLLRFTVTEIVDEQEPLTTPGAVEQATSDAAVERPAEVPGPAGSFRVDPTDVPTTVRQAAEMLAASYDAAAVDYLRSLPRQEIAMRYQDGREVTIPTVQPEMSHLSGMNLRNNWNLWDRESPIQIDAIRCYGIAHADDVSFLIFEWSYAIVRGEEFDPVNYCHRFHIHWERSGITSLQAAGR